MLTFYALLLSVFYAVRSAIQLHKRWGLYCISSIAYLSLFKRDCKPSGMPDLLMLLVNYIKPLRR